MFELLKIRGLGSFYDLGSLSVGVPSEEIAVHGIEKVAFGIIIATIGTNVVLHLEGKIGDAWYLLPDQVHTFTANGNNLIAYDSCSSIQQIRLLWLSSDGGTPTISAVVMPGKSS